MPFAVVLTALALLATAAAQQTAAPSPPVDARARLEKALAGMAERGTLTIELCWQDSSGTGSVVTATATGTCTSQAMHVRSGEREWLVSARNDLIRFDDNWVGARADERAPGFARAIPAALKACTFQILRRETGMLDDQPVETFTLRIPMADATALVPLTKPPALQHESLAHKVRNNVLRAVSQPDAGPAPITEVAVTIDPSRHEIRSMHLRFGMPSDPVVLEAPEPLRDGLPVRKAESTGVLVRFKPAAADAMPALDMDLRTRLRLKSAPPK